MLNGQRIAERHGQHVSMTAHFFSQDAICFDTVGWASGRSSGLQKLSDEVLMWLSVCSEVHIVCMWFH